MGYTVKIADFQDVKKVAEVERATMGDYVYVETAWNYFFHTKGAFLCAYEEDTLVGIAHLAILPDDTSWFEALRVHPDHQNKGVGKALYEKAIELIETGFHVKAISMYTGPKNVRSSGLAARYGLDNVYPFKEYSYTVTGAKDSGSFRFADWTKAEEILLPLKEQYHDFLSVNRTMLRFHPENLRAMADKNFLFEDDDHNAVLAGTRFQHGNKLFVSLIKGNPVKCLDFVDNLAGSRNIPSVACTFATDNKELEQALIDYGYTFSGDLIVRERVF